MLIIHEFVVQIVGGAVWTAGAEQKGQVRWSAHVRKGASAEPKRKKHVENHDFAIVYKHVGDPFFSGAKRALESRVVKTNCEIEFADLMRRRK
jgi:hypothetical protein